MSSHSFYSVVLQYPSVISHVISLKTSDKFQSETESQNALIHISAIIKKSLQLSDIQHTTLPPASLEVRQSN